MTIENGILKPSGTMQLRGGTAAVLAAENPLLARREIVVEVDTGKHKVGNGTDRWNTLQYPSGGSNNFTETELRRLGILLEALFPTDTDNIYIPYINDSDPENPILLPYTPFQNLPSGTPPDWVQRDFPTGFTAYSGVHKMWYGSYNWNSKSSTNGYIDNVLLALMLKGTTLSAVCMSSLIAGDETNYIWEPTVANGHYLDFLSVAKSGNYSNGLYYTMGEGVVCAYNSSSSTATLALNTVVTTSVLSDCNSLCYSEDLDKMLAVGATGSAVVMAYASGRYSGTASTKYTIGTSVNPASAAWSPDALVFCVTGSQGTATSPDGVTWETHTDSSVPKNLTDLTFREDLGCFFARSINDKLFYASGDGATWQAVNETPIPLTTVTAVDYTPATGIYCAVGGTGKSAYFSKDLETWVETSIANGADIEAGSVTYMPSTKRYVLMPKSGSYFYTFDPTDWITDCAETHNEHPSNNDLGTFSSYTSVIQSGTFTGIYPGDYFTFTDVAYSYLDENDEEQEDIFSGIIDILHLNYPQYCGEKTFITNSLLVAPRTAFFTAAMNDTNTTEGGYVGTKMRRVYLRRAQAIFEACFGAEHVLSHSEYLVNAVTNGIPSGVELCTSKVELMDERMIFGDYRRDSGVHNRRVEPETSIYPHRQVAAFKHNHELVKDSQYYWERNIYSSSNFCFVPPSGDATHTNASNVSGVRPASLIGVSNQ